MALTQSFQKLNRGDKAPDFSLIGVDDKTYSLSDVAGPPALEAGKEGLLVIFMCNHCPYVKAKMDALVHLHKKWGDRVGFVGINSNDPNYEGEGMENMKLFVKERNIQFPYVLDETQEVAKVYGAVCTPDPFLFDRDQKLVFHGRINDALQPGDPVGEDTMDKNIQNLLEGKPISDELKPSMGCSIKWID